MRIGVIGEGETEYYCVPTLVAKLGHVVAGVHSLGGVGTEFPWDKLFTHRIYPYVRGFAVKNLQNRPDRVVIVLDREERQECCGMLSGQAEGLLAQSLANENLTLPVSVVLANRQFECWLLADTTALDSSPLIKEPISPHLAESIDETDVLHIINGKLRRGCSWDKVRYGKALAQRLNIQDAAILNRSRSLRKFVKELSPPVAPGEV
jgi:Domain of unknown function (DUF4276)